MFSFLHLFLTALAIVAGSVCGLAVGMLLIALMGLEIDLSRDDR